MIRIGGALGAPLLLSVVALACTLEEAWRAPSILLVSLDTTRADRLGAYGFADAATPHIDRLAREGILFEQALAPTPITLPSHASLLTGVYPTAHGVRDNGGFALGVQAVLVSEVLREHGWRTAASVGSYVLDARFGLDQGFERYVGPRIAPDSTAIGASATADRVTDAALAWLDEVDPEERFFLFVHYYDPHAPYRPPRPHAQRHSHPYDAEIAFADEELGRLLRSTRERRPARDLLIVVTADHGESLGEHGEDTHGILIYQATQRIPLVFSGPPVARHAGTRVETPVSLTAVAPTLLALARVPRDALPAAVDPLLLTQEGSPAPETEVPIYVESYLPFHNMGWQALRGLVLGRDKLVLASRAELFDLVEDPDETRNLAETRAARVEALREELERFTEQRGDLGWGVARSPGASEIEMLHALGYAQGAGPQPGDPLDPALPDPRDRLEEHRQFEKGNTAWLQSRRLERRAKQSEDPAERERLLEAVRAARERTLAELAPFGASGNALLLDLIGKLALKLGEYERSAAALERAVALQPRIASTHFNLGLAYRGLGRGEDARMAFERAHRLEPERPGIAIMIARQYAEAGQRERARHWLGRARPLVSPGSGLEPAIAAVDRILAESREPPSP